MRHNPFDEMERMFDDLDRTLAGVRGSIGDRTGGRNADVGVDVRENDDEVLVMLDMPGFESEDIDLVFDDGVLRVDATHAVEREGFEGERRVFERIRLPEGVREDGIAATYKNGVLEVRLPREGHDDDSVHIDIE
jgi:HSP20 family protein